MKHTTILYTCIGLMGAAAITGFVDYTSSSKAGLLIDLYKEEPTTTTTLVGDKEVNLDAYSRGPLEEEIQVQEETILKTKAKISKKKNKLVVPQKPARLNLPLAPPQPDGDVIPPTPPKEEIAAVETEVHVPAEVVVPATIQIEAMTPVLLKEEIKVKSVSLRSFSRGPLTSKSVSKNKKGQ